MWWKEHVQEFPHLTRMTRQYLAVPATSAFPEGGEQEERYTHTHTHRDIHTLTIVSLAHTNIQIVVCTLTSPHTLPKLTDCQPTIDKHRILISFY